MLDLGSSILSSTERIPSSLAIRDKNTKLSYFEWFQKIDALSGSFKSLGLRKGNKVITLLQNNIEAGTIHWSCQMNGLIITPLNWRMTSNEIDFCISNSDFLKVRKTCKIIE